MRSSSTQPPANRRSQPAPAPTPSLAGPLAGDSPLATMLQQLRVRNRKPVSMVVANFTSAVEAVWANRTRSLLTMLGIFIGVAAVIAALTLTQSAGAYINNIVASLGSNTIIIDPGSTQSRGVFTKGTSQSLTLSDLQSVARLSHVVAITPVLMTGGGQVVFGNQNWRTRVQGVGVDYQTINSWDLAEGIWFTQAQDAGAQPVAVIGDTIVQNLFAPSHTDPIGQTIRFRNQLYRVIGVLAPKGGFNQDDIIYVPFNTARARLSGGGNNVDEIQLQADSSNNVDLTVEAITITLEQNHHIPKGSPDDFSVTTSQQILAQANAETAALTVLLVGIAAISLTVGGIGIMNIMLVSVTERTREIGIRMSIGARRADIRSQFLFEALVLCITGGAVGLLLGILVGYWMTSGGFPFGTALPFTLTPTTFILPFAVSAAIGIIFGLYPAVRAARLDPIVALRRAK